MALINLRNALMAGKRLPYDAEVEYIRGTGTQYINSGLTVSNALRVKCRVSTEGVCWIFGGRTRNNNKQFSVYQQASTNIRWGYANAAVDKTNSYGVHDIDFNQNAVYFDGALLHTFAASTFSSASPLYIGTLSTNESGTPASQCLIGNIYAFQVYVDGVLVRDSIPVRKGTVGYLYDRVTRRLFGNVGTGDFVLGPDVVPVEYIESHAAEYIDTGAIPDDSTGIEVVHTICPDNEKDNIIFGARQDSGNTRYWSDVDWGSNDNVGWGFNTYSGSSERFVLTSSDVGRIVTNSLNYMNDRAGKIDGVTYDSSLQSKTLATMNRSIYLFGANNMGTIAIRGVFRVYSAKISKGQTLVNKFLPVRVGTGSTWEGAMMDTLTRRIYRNSGTGAFTYGNDLKYPIPAA